MSGSAGPRARLSLVVVTDGLAAIEELLPSLEAQTARSQLELVLVVPSGTALGPDFPSMSALGAFQLLEVPSIVPLREARAEGVLKATAPVIVVGETHAYPYPGWAAALIEAHHAPWTAVVPTIENGNPGGAISVSNFLLSYGPWARRAGGEITNVPEQNTAFDRTVLEGYGLRLPVMLETGGGLNADLRAKGHRFVLASDARLRHVNVSRASTWLPERFHGGRAFAAARAAQWPVWRRLAYAMAFPLLAMVFLFRSLRATRWPEWQLAVPVLTLPALLVGVLAWVVGEALGYLAGDSGERSAEYEVNRQRYVTSSD